MLLSFSPWYMLRAGRTVAEGRPGSCTQARTSEAAEAYGGLSDLLATVHTGVVTEPSTGGDIPLLDDDLDGGGGGEQPTQVADLGGLARQVEFDHQMATDDLGSDEPTMVSLGDARDGVDDVSDDAPTAVRDASGKPVVAPPTVTPPVDMTPQTPPPVESEYWLKSMVAPLMVGVGFGFVVLAYLMLVR